MTDPRSETQGWLTNPPSQRTRLPNCLACVMDMEPHGHVQTAIVMIDKAVGQLDAINPDSDPERAYAEANKILLAAAPPEIRAAYERITARTARRS
jgi:hypothetical protein